MKLHLSDQQKTLIRKLGLPESVLVARTSGGLQQVSMMEELAGDAILVMSLAAVYGFLQTEISPDWLPYILAPLAVLLYRMALLRAETRGIKPHWLRNAGIIFVSFASIYTPLQWLIDAEWPAWVISALIVAVGWIVLQFIEAIDEP